MKVTGKLWKSGNSYVLTIPPAIVEALDAEPGTELEANVKVKK